MTEVQKLQKEAQEKLKALEAEIRYRNTHRINDQFKDEGPYRRQLYPRHLEFFEAGYINTERAFIAGNRTGKTRAGACETTYHLTGAYPDWWVGKRFTKPIDVWVAGANSQTVRDTVQSELVGRTSPDLEVGSASDLIGIGTGMIPVDAIRSVKMRTGSVAGSVESAYIRHKSGGTSMLGFKTYDQDRKSFEGTSKDYIWVDEECPLDIYLECLTRLMTTKGCMALTFTPLQGLTPTVLRFMPQLDAQ